MPARSINIRRARHRPAPPRSDQPPEVQIARIDDLTAAGRTNWFGLMAYLVFAFITVLGVTDADFFIPSRQTRLPLVNVGIPTKSFFYFAPVLATALYAYLHLHVRKVTAALTAAPATVEGTPLERHIKPWLLNDVVLRWRRDGAIDAMPMDWLATLTTVALIWLAGPFVLAAIWVRSWPAHDEWMTTIASLCLALSLYAGHVSWLRMTRAIPPRSRRRTQLREARHVLATALTIVAIPLVLVLGVIMFGRLKDWRRVATRYDRCPKVFLSAVALAATVIFWL